MSTSTWRVGGSVPLNVYDGNRPVCQCHTAEDTLLIVRSVNEMKARRGSEETISETVDPAGSRGGILRAAQLLGPTELGPPGPTELEPFRLIDWAADGLVTIETSVGHLSRATRQELLAALQTFVRDFHPKETGRVSADSVRECE